MYSCTGDNFFLSITNGTSFDIAISVSQCDRSELNLVILPKNLSKKFNIRLRPKECDGNFKISISSDNLNTKEFCYYPYEQKEAIIKVTYISFDKRIDVSCDVQSVL